ncbi:anti-sigma-D factor RsdA [Nocardia caishijiensis]|uniref:Anti-sigma-D factor RsdA-like protein n=1 Tax=Nocardia caishijiensis TaxID=184756 RepID=A0ABQ6YS43_9NOCA|nr:anti-sigma-D factor RsdA [Nocardia caishijiensis]KAF0848375.1 anti-sigma-D factor RsdA-like protein [Nocardia caishijiensis]
MARDGERGRGDRKVWRGSHDSGPYAAEGTGDSGPVDIAAVRSDDALIDAIASDGPVHTDSPEEFQLASLLADWRADLLAEPMPAGPDLDTVFAAVDQEIGARQVRTGASSRGRLRLVRPLLGSAAALAVVFGGITAFSYSAAPGDPLWRVKEVVFSEQAQSTVVARADDDLAAAQSMLASGDPEQARAKLEQASATADQVSDPKKREDLLARWNLLRDQLVKQAPELGPLLPPLVPPSTVPGSSGAPSPSPSAPSPSPAKPGTTDPASPITPGDPGTADPSEPPVILQTPGPEIVEPRPTEPSPPPVTTVPPTPPPVTVEPTQPPTTIAEPPPTVPTAVPPTPQVPTAVPTMTILPLPGTP